MAPTIIISLLAGGMLALVRYNGGIEFVIRATGRWIKSRRTCELGICFLTGLMNLFTANNTIAIITSGQLAKELGHRYGVNPKRIASLLDTTSCIVQGLIPYGAQILIATGLSTAVQLSAFDIVRGSFYPYLIHLSLITIAWSFCNLNRPLATVIFLLFIYTISTLYQNYKTAKKKRLAAK